MSLWAALKRFIQHHIESELARAMIRGEVIDGSKQNVDIVDGKMVVLAG